MEPATNRDHFLRDLGAQERSQQWESSERDAPTLAGGWGLQGLLQQHPKALSSTAARWGPCGHPLQSKHPALPDRAMLGAGGFSCRAHLAVLFPQNCMLAEAAEAADRPRSSHARTHWDKRATCASPRG